MSGRKTTISLDEKLFKEVKETAQDLKTSRSGVIPWHCVSSWNDGRITALV
jgi:hypothetical protein